MYDLVDNMNYLTIVSNDLIKYQMKMIIKEIYQLSKPPLKQREATHFVGTLKL